MKLTNLIPFRNVLAALALFTGISLNSQTNNPSPYCFPKASNMVNGTCTGTGSAYGYGFSFKSLSFDSINQSSGCYGSNDSAAYRYWPSGTSLHYSRNYSMTIETQKANGTLLIYFSYWIDFNQNNSFDSVEYFRGFGANPNGQQGIINGIRIPCNAKPGMTRLRVRLQYSSFAKWNEACNVGTGYGETWDFNVRILPPTVTADFILPDTAFIKTKVQFLNKNTLGTGSDAWDANADGIYESNASVYGFTYTSTGKKCITHRATNCSVKDSVVKCVEIITPKAKPDANFTVCRRTVQQYDYLEINDASGNGPWQWTWDVYDSASFASLSSGEVISDPLGTGADEHSKNPMFAFYEPGNYTVVLRARNDVGEDITVRKGYIRCLITNDARLGFGTYGPKNDNVLVEESGRLMDNGGLNTVYSNNQSRQTKSYMTLKPKSGEKINLRFYQFRVADTEDSLRIYDGDTVNPSKLIASLSYADNGTHPLFKSTGGKMHITFTTNASGNDSGFHAVYYTLGNDPDSTNLELKHNTLIAGRIAKFYNLYNNNNTFTYNKRWFLDGIPEKEFENMDTFEHVFTDTLPHSVCMELYNCEGKVDSVCISVKNVRSQGIYGSVFRDKDADCTRDNDETGFRYLKVQLYNSSNTLIKTTYTEKGGYYFFDPGQGYYTVKIDTTNLPYASNCSNLNYSAGVTLSNSWSIVNNIDFELGERGIMGVVYSDFNSNCSFDAGEAGYRNVPLNLYNSSNTLLAKTFTDKNGVYYFNRKEGRYRVAIDSLNINLKSTCLYPGTDSGIVLDSNRKLAGNVNFQLKCSDDFDVACQSYLLRGQGSPGKMHILRIYAGSIINNDWYGYICPKDITGTVTIKINGKVSYSGNAGTNTPSVSGKTFTYSVANFRNLDMYRAFQLKLTTDSTANLGDTIHVEVRVSPTIGDRDSSNNILRFKYTIKSSYDPNMKEVSPMLVEPGFKDWITYTVHFQNTGNAPASRVIIRDTLDTKLNPETFQLLHASHEMATSLNGKAMAFVFNDIELADSGSNYDSSMGYVQYRIKPFAAMPDKQKIANTAYIYFDYNSPIQTNTAYTEAAKQNSSVNSLNLTRHVFAYPNPSNGKIQFKANSDFHLIITDLTGRTILEKQNPKEIELPKGVYCFVYEIAGTRYVEKIVVY